MLEIWRESLSGSESFSVGSIIPDSPSPRVTLSSTAIGLLFPTRSNLKSTDDPSVVATVNVSVSVGFS